MSHSHQAVSSCMTMRCHASLRKSKNYLWTLITGQLPSANGTGSGYKSQQSFKCEYRKKTKHLNRCCFSTLSKNLRSARIEFCFQMEKPKFKEVEYFDQGQQASNRLAFALLWLPPERALPRQGTARPDPMKGLEMRRFPWIMGGGPKCNHRCPHRREAERELTHATEEATWPQRHRLETRPQAQEPSEPTVAGNGCSPEPPEGGRPDHFDFSQGRGFWTSDLQSCVRILSAVWSRHICETLLHGLRKRAGGFAFKIKLWRKYHCSFCLLEALWHNERPLGSLTILSQEEA